MDDYEKIMDCIKNKIEEKGIKQSHIAKISGVSESSVSRYINGQLEMPLDFYLNICKILVINPAEIINKAGED